MKARDKHSYMFLAWGLFVVFFIVYVDLTMAKQMQTSDYLTCFHTAGYVVTHGQLNDLYSPPTATGFAGLPFDKTAHEILKDMPPSMVAEYMYMPLSAFILAPFSMLAPQWSLLAWQLTSMAAVVACGALVKAGAKRAQVNSEARSDDVALYMLSSLPVVLTLWIGQVSIIFGMLPMCAGLYLLFRNQPIRAGLIWALAAMKPQFLIPIGFVVVHQLMRKRLKLLFAWLAGIAIILGLNVLIFGTATCEAWFRTMKLSDSVFSDPSKGVATHLATSLPRTLTLMFPKYISIVKPLSYTLAAVIGLITLVQAGKLAASKVAPGRQIALALILGLFATPLVVPHLYFYDFSLLAVAGAIVYSTAWSQKVEWRLHSTMRLTWLVLTVYAIIIMFLTKFALPIVLIGGLFVLLTQLISTSQLMIAEEVES